MSSPDQLILYHYEACFYCMRVRRALSRLGIEAEYRDVRREPAYRAELVAATGRRTVPVLRIESSDGTRWMPESSDIVRYLESMAGAPPPAAKVTRMIDRVTRRLKRGS